MKGRPRLATRLMQAQALVVGMGTLTLVISAVLVAPTLFHEHLIHTGIADAEVQFHAEEAFASAFAVSVALATVSSLLAAGAVSWFMVRRVSQPVEELADSAEVVATGQFDVTVPDALFSSELHRMSSSFNKMANRLAETDATRTSLLADLAHELRTPLATLEAYVDGMEDEVLPRDAASWTTMRDQIHRLRRLASDLREVTAAEEHALELDLATIDVRDTVQAAVTAAVPRYISKGVTLDTEMTNQVMLVNADQVRLQQVWGNILDNALRHTRPVGRVFVTVDRDGTGVRVSVADTGEGIPHEQVAMVFERFHRVDASRVAADGSGSGLGLTIARAILADHGGTIRAFSEGPGLGSRFDVWLPQHLA